MTHARSRITLHWECTEDPHCRARTRANHPNLSHARASRTRDEARGSPGRPVRGPRGACARSGSRKQTNLLVGVATALAGSAASAQSAQQPRRGTARHPASGPSGRCRWQPSCYTGCSTGAPGDVAGSRAHAAAGSGGTSCSHAADGAARRLHRECCQSLHGDALPCAGDAAVGERRGTVQLPAGGRWPDKPFVPLRAWNRHCRGARASVSRVRRGLGGHG